mgnify:CR=1 FL=1
MINNPKDKIQKQLVAIFIAAFLLLFIFNLFRGYRKADISGEELATNLTEIEQLQLAEVSEIEAAVNALDKASGTDITRSQRIRYRRAFANSIILGDSLTEGLTVYNWLTEAQVSAKVGGSIIFADEQFANAAKSYPKYAFFAFGMNDMGNYGGDEKAFVEKYRGLLKQFAEISPDTKICVNSISTPTPAAVAGNKSIGHYQKFNEAIKKMCEEEKYTFIDISDILPSHPDLYAGDGIHADPTYYPVWMDRMMQASGMK